MLHFVLAMMTPSAAAALFTDTVLDSGCRRYSRKNFVSPACTHACQDVKLLAKARAMKSFTVYQDRRGARCLLLPVTSRSACLRCLSKTNDLECPQDCTELTQGFQAIREICQTGPSCYCPGPSSEFSF